MNLKKNNKKLYPLALTCYCMPFINNKLKASCLSNNTVNRLSILSLALTDQYHKVSEYDQEIPQLQTADQHMAPRGRATLHLQ